MYIYDSVKRDKVKFEPISDRCVNVYLCGVTVYDYSHIGHARSAITFDLLHRVLLANGYSVNFIKNFTDIDDKILNKMRDTNSSLKEITNRYIDAYNSDFEQLNILNHTKPKATEFIKPMVKNIKKLVDNKYAYVTDSGDVYFDSSKDSKYLSISGKDMSETVSRLEESGQKHSSSDYILWKSKKDGESVSYSSPFGDGRPGWHTECYSIIDSLVDSFGQDYILDIHCGGSDLLFPHHENEASQARCNTGKELSKYWMHNGFVSINETKMSKSLNNTILLKDILKRYDGEIVRYYLLSVYYRADFNFSYDDCEIFKKRLNKIYRLKKRVIDIIDNNFKGMKSRFGDKLLAIISDDLNVSEAYALIEEYIKKYNDILDSGKELNSNEINSFFTTLNSILGIGGSNYELYLNSANNGDITREEIEKLIEIRDIAKKEKDYKKADEIREQLKQLNVKIMDSKTGSSWEYV